jgi:hypothetical protein
MFLRTGPFNGKPKETWEKRREAARAQLFSGEGELAFLGDPFEGFGRAFDAVLAVVAVGGQQADHLVGAAGGGRATLLAVK